MSRQALGRGLGALIPEKKTAEEGERVVEAPVDEISPGRFQPRTVFDDESLKDLARSIKERGVIQPVILCRKRNGYELIAGERRWRAVKSLGLKTIPAIVKVVRDSEALEMAIIENIQRENLNPMEEAYAYDRLMREFAFTQESLAKKVGKSRSAVANMMRLLRLPDPIKNDLADGLLTMGHARALLALDTDHDRMSMRDQILRAGMNVRQVETHVKARSGKRKPRRKAADKNVFIQKLEIDLERRLSAKVSIKTNARGGLIQIHYHDLDDLNRIVEELG